jgi:uncharacterized membrane protein YqiK
MEYGQNRQTYAQSFSQAALLTRWFLLLLLIVVVFVVVVALLLYRTDHFVRKRANVGNLIRSTSAQVAIYAVHDSAHVRVPNKR